MIIKGCDEVISRLNSLGRVSGSLEAAEIVASYARTLCPVDTGYLRSTIAVSSDGDTATVSATAPYAAYVELGTVKQAPQPFLLPAFLSCEGEILSVLLRKAVRGDD